MTDPPEVRRDDVIQKAFQERYPGDGFGFLLVAVFAVAPTKGNLAPGYIQYPRIGDGHPVGIPSQVFHHTFR